jgi:hypothetical protein
MGGAPVTGGFFGSIIQYSQPFPAFFIMALQLLKPELQAKHLFAADQFPGKQPLKIPPVPGNKAGLQRMWLAAYRLLHLLLKL